MDEADEMLNEGFKEQIYQIFLTMPEHIQVILLSATMPSNVLEITKKFMNNPKKILVKQEEITLEGIRQFYVNVEQEVNRIFVQKIKFMIHFRIQDFKFETLCDLYETLSITKAIIFCNTGRKVQWLTEKLNARDFTVSAIVSLIQLYIVFIEEEYMYFEFIVG